MRFGYTEEQDDLREAVRGFFTSTTDSQELRRAAEPGAAYNTEQWSELAEQLGLIGLTVSEEQGGSGASFVELAVVLEESGSVLLNQPLFASAVLAVSALQQSGDEEAQNTWLPELASGSVIGTFAHHGALDDLTATEENGAWKLSGSKKYIIDGEAAQLVLVPAQTADGVTLFAVDTRVSAPEFTAPELMDPTRKLAHAEFNGVTATRVGQAGGAEPGIARTLDIAAVALSAEMLGVAQKALNMAVEYAGTRVQFGRPIGSFQAIKHHAANMFIDVETSRALVMQSSWTVDHAPEELQEIAKITLAHVSDACFRTVSMLLQVLGGIGYTWEHDGHFYFKRGRASGLLFGSADAHREGAAQAIGL